MCDGHKTSGKSSELIFASSRRGVAERREIEIFGGNEMDFSEKLATAFVRVRKSAPRIQSLARLSTTKTGNLCVILLGTEKVTQFRPLTERGEPSAADMLTRVEAADGRGEILFKDAAKGELMQETAAPLSTSARVGSEFMKQERWGRLAEPVCNIAFRER